MAAYYNEFDPGAAAWLRELIKRGLIADGEVDERSILAVAPDDLRGFRQCHFFAGVGGWSHALRLSGWPDDRAVWTGSPPCQPFSAAGQQLGRDDPRHLAPHFIDLVRACRPRVLFGEQVASSEVFGKAAKPAGKRADGTPGWAWIDDLSDRLEAARYAVGASDFASAVVGAPHIRQRTFFGAVPAKRMEHPESDGRQQRGAEPGGGRAVSGCGDSRLADANGRDARAEREQRSGEQGQQPQDGGISQLADADRSGPQGRRVSGECADQRAVAAAGMADREPPSGTPDSPWSDPDWIFCRDGKWRPVEPEVFGMADGIPGELVHSGAFVPASSPLAPKAKDARRVMRLRGYGNAINPHAAKEFILAFDAAANNP